MDEAQREYLDAINTMVANTTPQQPPLTDEVVWLQLLISAIQGIGDWDTGLTCASVDDLLAEFKKRFRQDEISN